MLKIFFSSRMLVAFLMGFSSGLPLLLTITVLQAWMKQEGVDLSLIGMMSLVGIPYTLKFLWSPFLDRFTLPFLGRRRGWLFITQIALLIAIASMALTDPKQSPFMVAFAAFFVTFFSATQDILIDAYRREDLSDEELGLGVSLYINGYRIGMLLASGGGLIMADKMSFQNVYLIMAACIIPGIITTLFAKEPDNSAGKPASIKDAVILPLMEYFTRKDAFWILAFILLYKIGDIMATAITTPFYMDIGFTKTQIGTIVKLFGFWATIIGSLSGGALMLKLGINRSLWIFGFLQAAATSSFIALAYIGNNLFALASVIAFENLTIGMGTSAYSAFMASITNKKFTATQYALLSSLMGIPRVLASAPTGYMVKFFGWKMFFILCTFIAIPGMLLLIKFAPWNEQKQ